MLRAASTQLEQALRTLQRSGLAARLLLRFLVELCNARVLSTAALCSKLQDLLDGVRAAFTGEGVEAGTIAVSLCDADNLLFVVLSALPWAASLADDTRTGHGDGDGGGDHTLGRADRSTACQRPNA